MKIMLALAAAEHKVKELTETKLKNAPHIIFILKELTIRIKKHHNKPRIILLSLWWEAAQNCRMLFLLKLRTQSKGMLSKSKAKEAAMQRSREGCKSNNFGRSNPRIIFNI